MAVVSLDDFRDVSDWASVTSGEVQLELAQDAGPRADSGGSLRLDFDFKGGGGFVVARRPLARAMPPIWALELELRGAAPANKLEIKLIDPTNRNVWWWRRDAGILPADWTTLRVRSSEVTFAWGPAGGGTIRELGFIELAIVAGDGGRGSAWIADLRFEDLSLSQPPRVSASSAVPGHAPEQVLDAAAHAGWRSEGTSTPQWLALDFGREHEYGGLVIDWGPEGAPRAFDVQCSDDGAVWITRWSARQAEGARSYVFLAEGARSRHVRLHLVAPGAGADVFAIRALEVRPFEFSRSLAEFFHAVAACERRGLHPRWLLREQSYWTPVGVEGGTTAAILNEEGMLEPDLGSFSLEPFLFADGELITWADAARDVSLAEGCLPIPTATWRGRGLVLTTTAFAVGPASRAATHLRYRIANESEAPQPVRLFVAVRPFQVTPPWQAHDGLGGPAAIASLAWRDGAVEVDGRARVFPQSPPAGFGAAAFEQGGVMPHLERGRVPVHSEVADAFNHASGALFWDFDLAPGTAREIDVVMPFEPRPPLAPQSAPDVAITPATLSAVQAHWEHRLSGLRVRIGAREPEGVTALRTATAHILVNRDGPALQPGPRRYARSWIRDSAFMAAALLRMGCADEVRDFLAWYLPHQAADGNVPCAAGRKGPDWLPEHDSHGQLVFTLAEHLRFSGDHEFARRSWPAARRAIAYLAQLRAARCTPEFEAGARIDRFGLLPESVSHEGYLAQPVHSYWDDFWALRGIGDGVDLARALGDEGEAATLAAMRDDFRRCLRDSIAAVIESCGIDYVPASVEWADLDPPATALAVVMSEGVRCLPPAALKRTFDAYMDNFRRRARGEVDWNNYSAYEIRILGALVRLGRREEAHGLLEFFLADRRPRAWNQWPEISWRDPRSPGHLGDVPHTWIAAEYVLALLAMFAYEDPTAHALVIGAGISDAWLDRGDVSVEALATWWGPVGYTLRRSGADALRLDLAAGLRPPPGGVVLRPPLPRPLQRVDVDGAPWSAFRADAVTLPGGPASVVMRF
jgi:hypothetical protein